MLPPPVRVLTAATPAGIPGIRSVVRSGLARVFGPPPFAPDADPGDPGLFGEGSASWRVIGEPASIVGGVRALLVQLLHPLAMAGVADHSRFRDDPLGRLRATSAYVATTTFGSTRQALAVARAVRATHRRVTGSAPDGRVYRADEPELLAWVSVALTSSFLAADQAFAPRPADRPTADRFVAEQSRGAALLDPRVDLLAAARDDEALAGLRAGVYPLPLVDDGTLPRSRAELDARLDDFRGRLAVGAQARETLRFLLWPQVPASLKAGYLPLLAGALATLDAQERRLLGVPGGSLVTWPLSAQAGTMLTAWRLASGTSPSLEAARRRVAAGQRAPRAA